MSQFDKSKLPSRHATEGPERAPHRAFYYAMGLTEKEIHQPFIGVATTWNETAPCNITLRRQAQAVKRGVTFSGGTPREFTTITVTDGIAMGHQGMKASLVSREAIADTVELAVRGHAYDGLVGIAGCDKSLPAMMMAMLRLNVPSVFIYGGSILPGKFEGRDVTVQDVFEAVGRHFAGDMKDAELLALEKVACPSGGSCGGQFTANTMACVAEAIGLALPNSTAVPAPYESRDEYSEAAGREVMRMIADGLRPRDIVTRKSLENAATVVAASGGSTNAGLHLPAMANEAGIEFTLLDVAEIFKRTPYIADLKPGGRYVAKDLYEAGGVPIIMKALLDGGFLHGDCVTVTGRTLAENLADVVFPTAQDVVRPTDAPITPTGGVVGLRGNLAPEGAIVKVAGPGEAAAQWPGARVRLRGRRVRRRRTARLRGRRRARHPLRGAARRTGNARDAGDHGGALRPGLGQQGGTDHRRPVLRRHARLLHRPRRTRGGDRRADRPVAGRRHHLDRRGRRPPGRGAVGRGTGGTAPVLERAPERAPVGRVVEVRATRRSGGRRRRHPSGRPGGGHVLRR